MIRVGVIRIVAHASLVLGALVFTLALGEIALRIAGGERERGDLHDLHVVRPDRPWLYGLRPGADLRIEKWGGIRYRINADGFRGRRAARPKPEATFRVLLLGDSVSFGISVNEADSYPARLESLLVARAPGRPQEVLNLAVNGYNPYLEAALLSDLGSSYEPDLVLVQFCINDLNDPTLHFEPQTRRHLGGIPDDAYPDPTARRRTSPETPGWLALCGRLRLCTLADRVFFSWRVGRPDSGALRDMLEPRSDLSNPSDRAWLARRYSEMARAAQAMGARFAVIAFPFATQLEGPGRQIQADLVALGHEGGWPTFDLLPGFLAAAESNRGPLFLDLWHPTPEGHRVAAQTLLEALEAERLLPPASPRAPGEG